MLISGGLGSLHGMVLLVRRELGGTGGGPKMGGHVSTVGAQTSIPIGRGVIPCVAYLAVIIVKAKASPLARLEFLGAVSSRGGRRSLLFLLLWVVRGLKEPLI